MRLHPVDGLLYLTTKVLKHLDRRETDIRHLNPSEIKKILVVSSTAIGDTLLSTPAIRAIRKRYPQAKIFAHFNIKNMELFRNNPYIDGTIPYYGGYKKFLTTVKEFRRHKFDCVLIFHGNEPQASPMAYLSGARFIIKLPLPKKYSFLLSNSSISTGNIKDCHAIDVRLKVASLAGCAEGGREMDLIVEEDDRSSIEQYIEKLGISEDKTIVGFQAGAATKYKMWPAEYFIELGKRLASYKKDLLILLTGSGKERDLCRQIAQGIGECAISTAGEISLRQLCALLEKMAFLVTNDTGTMHMAIALKTRTISLFCPTSSKGIGPVQDLHLHKVIDKNRPCSPCLTKKCKKNGACMRQITVDEVYQAARDLIDENSPV